MRKRTKTMILGLSFLFFTVGCGQKGPLYLPEAPEQTKPESQFLFKDAGDRLGGDR